MLFVESFIAVQGYSCNTDPVYGSADNPPQKGIPILILQIVLQVHVLKSCRLKSLLFASYSLIYYHDYCWQRGEY